MRTLDLDQSRPQVGEFTLGGKTFKVMRRTIGQELMHRLELDKVQKELKKIAGNGKDYDKDVYEDKLHGWFAREIQIFVPEFAKKDFEKIDHDQRVKILEMIFEKEEEPEAVESPRQVQKKREKGSRGGK